MNNLTHTQTVDTRPFSTYERAWDEAMYAVTVVHSITLVTTLTVVYAVHVGSLYCDTNDNCMNTVTVEVHYTL